VTRWTALGERLPGARARAEQVLEFTAAWARSNELALAGEGPLWIVLGDSGALAIGATAFDRGYVGRITELMRAQRDPAWRVVNLARSGVRTVDVVAEQLPQLAELPTPDLVSCSAGINDVLRGPLRHSAAAFDAIAAAMPPGSVMATMPRGMLDLRSRTLNGPVRAAAQRHGHVVADLWATTGPPWRGTLSTDWFHPNDRGYEGWTTAFARVLALDL